jgi:hypothetical protein
MGIDLKMFASHFRERSGEFLATATLRFDRDAGPFAQLAPDVEPRMAHPLPAGLRVGHYEGDGLRWDEADRQGRPLTFTTPADLRRLRLPDDIAPWAVFVVPAGVRPCA